MTIKYIWEGRYIADYDENQDENQVDIYSCLLKDIENGRNRMEYLIILHSCMFQYMIQNSVVSSILLLYIPGYGEG